MALSRIWSASHTIWQGILTIGNLFRQQRPPRERQLLANCIDKVFSRHDESHVYQLPFSKWQAFLVLQGYGGSYSHIGDSYYSLDFDMPVGTQVFAARAGTVVSVIDHFAVGGANPELGGFGNKVCIQHSDGSVAKYFHLMKEGAHVGIGQRVSAGDLIAFSGNTGWSTRPHLHFHVEAKTGERVPTKFAVRTNKVEYLKGRWYSNRPGKLPVAELRSILLSVWARAFG